MAVKAQVMSFHLSPADVGILVTIPLRRKWLKSHSTPVRTHPENREQAMQIAAAARYRWAFLNSQLM